MTNTQLGILFAILWVVTFLPAWYLLGKLVVYSASPGKRLASFSFISLFISYQLVIALPYIPVLIFGTELSGFVKSVVVGIITVGFLLSLVRFFVASRVEKVLWGIYGYVYDGLRYFYPYTHLLSMAAERLEIEPESIVLDLGCGSGNGSLLIANQKPSKLVSVDSSSSMLRPAYKKLKTFDFVTIKKQDALSFLKSAGNEEFDRVLMVNVLYAVNDREVLWRELMRVTKKDARIIMTSSDRDGNFAIIKEHLAHASFFKLLHPKLLGVFIVDSLISSFAGQGVFHFISKEEMIAEIEAAGGKVSDIERCYGGKKDGVNIMATVTK